MTIAEEKRGRQKLSPHPYLTGNFAPITQVVPLTPCSYTGTLPDELAGGEYVRNGGNPVTNEDLGRDAHWFDGDGMLSGVAFRRLEEKGGRLQPEFVNQYILTDVYLSSLTTRIRTPVIPSIATLVNPLSSLVIIILRIFRAIILVILSHLPGSQQAIKKISVANTGFLYHDGRALATCESGPPIRMALPGLETVGWFDGIKAEGEPWTEEESPGFGGEGIFGFMKEWTTAHPRVDPITNELILFHSTFVPPYVNYSIVPSTYNSTSTPLPRLLNASVPGVSAPRMMHDFAVSFTHTIILDLPLSLNPLNLARNEPVVSYDPSGKSRFGVFPRRNPEQVRWFETSAACCIFHTANTWDETTANSDSAQTVAVNMLACRLTSSSLIFSAGNLPEPAPKKHATVKEEEQCRLYYYRFDLASPLDANSITHQWALSAIPFEFPSLCESASMSNAKYIYGTSVSNSTFGAALGRAVKIDCLVKMDVHALVAEGIKNPPTSVTGCVDTRSVDEILAANDPNDSIKIFKMPSGWYAQESRFVPRKNGNAEDDGWILSYVFDESQLDEHGEAPPDAKSELWIIEAKEMKDVVAKIQLPQRVPYGLHGNWFDEQMVLGQRPIETIRTLPSLQKGSARVVHSPLTKMWMGARSFAESVIG